MNNISLDTISIVKQFSTLTNVVCDISESYYYLGRLDDAINLLEVGLQIAEQREIGLDNKTQFLLQYGKLLATGNLEGNKDYDKTVAVLMKARQMAEAIPHQQKIAAAMDLLGLTYYYQKFNTDEGDFNQTLNYFQQALAGYETIKDERGISDALFHRGLVCQYTGKTEEAISNYTRAYQLAEGGGYKLEQSYAARHLGLIAFREKKFEEAYYYLQESLTLRQEIGFKIFLPSSYLALGHLLATQDNPKAAFQHYRQACILAEAIGSKSQLMLALISMGELYQTQGEVSQAQTHLEQGYALAQARDDKQAIEYIKKLWAA